MQRTPRGRVIFAKYKPEQPLEAYRFPSPSRFQIHNKCKCIPVPETERNKTVSNWIMRGDYAVGDPSSWVRYPDEIQLLCDLPKEQQDGYGSTIRPRTFGEQVDIENQVPCPQTEFKSRGFGLSNIQNSAHREPLASRRQQQQAVNAPMVREFMSTDRKLAFEQQKLSNHTSSTCSLLGTCSTPGPVPYASVDESKANEEYDYNNSNDIVDFIHESEVLTYSPYIMAHYPVIPIGYDNNDPYLEAY